MKQHLIQALRLAHLPFAGSDLPHRVALYFHDLMPEHVGAFRDAIQTFLDRGYRSVGPMEYAQDSDDDARKLFVSFDDNYRSWYEALETFEALGISCTFYVNTLPLRDIATPSEIETYFDRINYGGDRTPLSQAELRALSQAGHNIGCHTHSHFVLSAVPEQDWHREIDQCKTTLEDITGTEVCDFSFPFGMRRHFSPQLRTYCREHGFRTIATAIPGRLNAAKVDPLAIHRSEWKFNRTASENMQNLTLNARLYGDLFGRSVIG